jgi:hypothetical protein
VKPPPNFRKSFDHQGLVLNSTIGALAHLQIGRAYAMQGDTAKSSCRLSRFPHALERRRSRHLHSEASQGGVRQAAVKPCSFVLFWFSAEAAVLLEALSTPQETTTAPIVIATTGVPELVRQRRLNLVGGGCSTRSIACRCPMCTAIFRKHHGVVAQMFGCKEAPAIVRQLNSLIVLMPASL